MLVVELAISMVVSERLGAPCNTVVKPQTVLPESKLSFLEDVGGVGWQVTESEVGPEEYHKKTEGKLINSQSKYHVFLRFGNDICNCDPSAGHELTSLFCLHTHVDVLLELLRTVVAPVLVVVQNSINT
eukprot:691953-Amphidinium_carterae.1